MFLAHPQLILQNSYIFRLRFWFFYVYHLGMMKIQNVVLLKLGLVWYSNIFFFMWKPYESQEWNLRRNILKELWRLEHSELSYVLMSVGGVEKMANFRPHFLLNVRVLKVTTSVFRH